MSVLKFRDQDGRPVWGLATRIARGHGDTHAAEDERYPDKAGATAFVGVKQVLPSSDGHTVHVNYNEGLNPDWRDYVPVSEHFPDIEAIHDGYTITVQRKSVGLPPPAGEFDPLDHSRENIFLKAREWFIGLVRKHNLSTITPESLAVLQPDMLRKGIEFQHTSGGSLRPRLHFPPADVNHYERNIDLGDFPGDGPHTTYGQVWEVRGWPDRWQ